jgi:DNA-binding PadR family transcriptional regulator
MIEHELILLGLLKEGPKHGYDIKVKINEILSLFTGVSVKSIYYPLTILEKKGLVVKHVTKPSRRPPRTVYALTARGEHYFDELLNKSFLDFRRPEFSLDLSLYFLRFMKRDVSQRRLRARMQILKKIIAMLQVMIKKHRRQRSSAVGLILEHNLRMVGAELSFLASLIKTV